ncbi:MAG TPA: MmcQ/YjbR family DNA-binding protein [Solirubrobacteraceae bacterium]|nr:MmcQ/YjbR family DNA-binding protein [Solirubrobacteraceae bacterium]
MAAGVSAEQAAAAALALPDSIEAGHHGRRSFRVAGAIFATLWDEDHLNVMLDEPGIRTAVQAHPEACAEFWWGRRLRAVQVDLRRARASLVSELLADAWERRAGRPAADR